MKKNSKRVLSALLALSVTGSVGIVGFAEETELPQGVIRIQQEENSSIPVGAYVFQDENYEGDFLEGFDITEWNGPNDTGTMAVVSKAVDPVNSENHVLSAKGEGKTSTRYTDRTAVPLYQGVLNPKNANHDKNYTPASLGYTKGYVVFEAKAYFDKKFVDEYGTYHVCFQPSESRTAYHRLAPFDEATLSSVKYFQVTSNQNLTGTQTSVRKNLNCNQWYTYKFIYNCGTNESEYLINNELIWKGTASRIPSIAAGMKFFSPNLIGANVAYFDDVKSYWYCPAPGATAEFNAANDMVAIKFQTAVTSFTADNVTVSKDNAAVENAVTEVALAEDGLTANVTIDSTKIADGGYSLSLTNVKDCFDQDVVLAEPLELSLPSPGATMTFSSADRIVRLDFTTGVTSDLTIENIQVYENGTAITGKVSDIVTANDKSYAEFKLDCSEIGAKNTTIALVGLTDKFNQAVTVVGDSVIHAPAFTVTDSEIADNAMTVTFSNTVSSFTSDNLTVTDTDERIVNNAISNVSFDGKTATIKFGASVKGDKEYTIAIQGVRDEFSSSLAKTEKGLLLPVKVTLYHDDYTDFNEESFDNKQPYGNGADGNNISNHYTMSYIQQTVDPLDSTNKAVTVYGTGKTDTRYPNVTTLTIAQASLYDVLKNKTSKDNNTDNLIVYETDMYLSDALLDKLSTATAVNGICLSPSPKANGDAKRPLINNTSIVSKDGKFKMISSDKTFTPVEFNAKTWVNFKYVVDHKNNKFSIYINDSCALLNYSMNAQNIEYFKDGCAGIAMYYKGASADNLIQQNEIYFDNTNVYELPITAGVTSVNYNPSSKTATVEFNTPVTSSVVDKIYISDDAAEIVNAVIKADVSADGYCAILTLSDKLMANRTYYVNFRAGMYDVNGQPIYADDNTYSFTTAKSKSVYVVDGTIASTGGANPTVSFKLNSMVDGASAWIGIGFYDQYNQLIGLASDNVTVTGETQKEYTIKDDCTNAIKFGIFVWDNVDNMLPLQRAEFTEINN